MATVARPGTHMDDSALAAALRRRVAGDVGFDAGSRALYATDASNYRQVPLGVVVPRDRADVIAALAVAREHGVPVLPRGGGTSLAGQACNFALVLDASQHCRRLLALDPEARLATVEPGIVCDTLNQAAAPHGLYFGPDPSTHSRCTLGGMIGNNACGAHSVVAGKTVANVERLTVLTYDGLELEVGPTPEDELERIIAAGGRRGEIYAGLRALRDRYAEVIRRGFPAIRRRVSGYNLDALLPENGFDVARALVGTEGTCVTLLDATVRLLPRPAHRVLAVLGYPDICTAGDHAPAILETGPQCIEGLDEHIIGDMRKKGLELGAIRRLPQGQAWLMVEYAGATPEAAREAAEAALAGLGAPCLAQRLYTDPADQATVWSIRESGAAATNAVPGEPETYPGWEDAAVDPQRVGDYLREYRALLARYGYKSSLYGHFGDGCIHGRITFDLSSEDGVAAWRRFMEEAADLVVRFGGSLSGEHGDGHARAELWPRLFGPELMRAFAEFKRIWDPDGRMNPGKLIAPYRLDEHLRTGRGQRPKEPATYFTFERDEGRFSRAAGRCVGVGKCRRVAGGVMCPSYRATGEERHSTRGRARLLFEMLEGDPLADGWDSEPVKEALDLCLACKGCRHECPVQVDMATYKAEFMAHYYERHRRPRQALSMGRLREWVTLAAYVPWLVNGVAATPGLSALARRIAGIAPERAIPRLSSRPFRRRWRPSGRGRRGPVLLWADTFNDHFHAGTLVAAAEVLERCGFEVRLPRRPVCCGRPLYDFGLLTTARRRLAQVLSVLGEEIDAGVPVVGLEPACLGTFRDELPNLLPDDPRSARLAANTWTLPDFLALREDLDWPRLEGRALVHGHCHHKALLGGMDGTRRLLERLGLEVEMLASGCCGMAGSFGFHPDKYELSLRIGEETLLPAVRAAAPDTLIVSDGYSCREQIVQTTGREVLHTAEVLRRALGGSGYEVMK
ncbi:FAD-binding and (Fe-S)-binding domain-containing protein [Spiribacter halobius]|uniref:FAD-binding oxidoreductase n=1 Tax=Sediminicurvatus halobius TaxID=2182432 RepID=A0A2U2N1E6_9GAMM|nr:FAD-binding and (Fe-S)-binding domain-containing protein [Spiribacter halobius]PWG62789.1 FAD-binding oxidoreductase [Spiribacter halobius]UEX77064.1 FAD-binding oxidoreductase [Spiribacter halobius]